MKNREPRGGLVPEALHVLPSMIGGSAQRPIGLSMGIRVNAGPSRSELCHCAVPHASCSATHRKQEVKGAIGGPARGTRGCEIRKIQEIAGKETDVMVQLRSSAELKARCAPQISRSAMAHRSRAASLRRT